MSKYTIIKGKTGKSKKVIVEGTKKVLYKKAGSRKMYVMSKGKMMQLTKYKKMKTRKVGGSFVDMINNLTQAGGKKKRKKTRKPKK